jgi:hypothetical protein
MINSSFITDIAETRQIAYNAEMLPLLNKNVFR